MSSTAKASGAWLISGAEGVGKQQLALHAAQSLLCQVGAETACQQCPSCLLFNADHPDFIVIKPEAAHSLGIEPIRSLAIELTQTPQVASRQVVWIQQAERMTVQAANALLKTLEEPNGAVVILLTTTRARQLLPTIRSRCQQIRIDVAKQEAKAFLAQHIDNETIIERLLVLTQGAPLAALAMYQHQELLSKSLQQLPQVLEARIQPSVWLSQLPDELKSYVAHWLTCITVDLLAVHAGVKPRYFPHWVGWYQSIAANTSVESWQQFLLLDSSGPRAVAEGAYVNLDQHLMATLHAWSLIAQGKEVCHVGD